MELRRAVITGMGAVTPLGNDLASFWNALLKGVSGAGPITRFDARKFKTQFACEVKALDPTEHLEPREARKLDLFNVFAMVSADQAIRDSGLDLDRVNKDRVGVIWSTGIGGIKTFQEETSHFATGDGEPRFSPLFVTKMIADMSSGLISIRYGFRGVNFVTVAACASSTNALIDALNYVRLGKADLIVTGGCEAGVTEIGIGGFNAMRALSVRNDSPQTASRPFDVDRDGFVMGEGAGALVVEELEHARRRGARIYAELAGGGLAADAYHVSASHPEGEGALLGMKNALEDAGLSPRDVDYINAHATSTGVGDVSEIKAIDHLFNGSMDGVSISATKSMTGHLLGGAGAIEAIICALSIRDNVVPPTINTEKLDPIVPKKMHIVLREPEERHVDVAISNTFGFGGHNAIAVLKRFSN